VKANYFDKNDNCVRGHTLSVDLQLQSCSAMYYHTEARVEVNVHVRGRIHFWFGEALTVWVDLYESVGCMSP